MNDNTKQIIEELINKNRIVLFMKGNKERPQCGFSKQVVDVLKKFTNDFKTIDVLQDNTIREEIKTYSSWPTIPQLYVDQEFIGGCDIVLDLLKSDELARTLKVNKASSQPNIKVLKQAVNAFIDASKDCNPGEYIRVEIDAEFQHSLGFDQKHADDFLISVDGAQIIIDPYSSLRANNLEIDFIVEDLESGFAFDNPNAPSLVEEITVQDLKKLKAQDENFLLIDVRPKDEWEKAHISFAKILSEMTPEELSELDKDQTIIFHCHMGGRSLVAAESFKHQGFTNVYNLKGGIDAWSKQVDNNVPTY